MDLIYRDGTLISEAMVYEGASFANLSHTIPQKDGSKLLVHDSNISFLNQIGILNIPFTSLEYHRD